MVGLAITVAPPICCVRPYMSIRVGAATAMPFMARWTSILISPALWYRSAGSLAIAFSTMASAQLGISGSTTDGGTGFSRTCW